MQHSRKYKITDGRRKISGGRVGWRMKKHPWEVQCSVLGGGKETCPEKCLHGNDVFTVRASAVSDDCGVVLRVGEDLPEKGA